MKVHHIKCDSEFYEAVRSGEKPFEIRLNDRGYQRGDQLFLEETTNHGTLRTGRRCCKDITFVLSGWGIESGYVALGICDPKQPQGGRDE